MMRIMDFNLRIMGATDSRIVAPKIHVLLKFQNVTLFVNNVFADVTVDVIKVKNEIRNTRLGWILNLVILSL